MAQIKLAEALLRRKELQEKVGVLKSIDHKGLFELRVKRVNVTDSVDEVTANVPKITADQVTRCYDWLVWQLTETSDDPLSRFANMKTLLLLVRVQPPPFDGGVPQW